MQADPLHAVHAVHREVSISGDHGSGGGRNGFKNVTSSDDGDSGGRGSIKWAVLVRFGVTWEALIVCYKERSVQSNFRPLCRR